MSWGTLNDNNDRSEGEYTVTHWRIFYYYTRSIVNGVR